MIKKIKLSNQTTIVIETVQPAENISKEVNIYLKSEDDIQDLLLVREKLAQEPSQQVLTSDPHTIEVLTWTDPTDENYTNRTLISKRTSLWLRSTPWTTKLLTKEGVKYENNNWFKLCNRAPWFLASNCE